MISWRPRSHGERQDQRAIAAVASSAARSRRSSSRAEIELADGAEPEAEAMGARVPGEPGELGFDGGQDARDLRR